jgi:hypothetical protein
MNLSQLTLSCSNWVASCRHSTAEYIVLVMYAYPYRECLSRYNILVPDIYREQRECQGPLRSCVSAVSKGLEFGRNIPAIFTIFNCNTLVGCSYVLQDKFKGEFAIKSVKGEQYCIINHRHYVLSKLEKNSKLVRAFLFVMRVCVIIRYKGVTHP